MANTLTGLIPNIYKAADRVMREQIGFVPSVYLDPSAEMVAKDQVLRYPIVGAFTADNIAPANVSPQPSDVTVGYGDMSISKARAVKFYWTGEEQASLGGIYENVVTDQFAQAMRTLINEVEVDLFTAAKTGASRAYGTAGTPPFGTAANFTDFAEVGKILRDNGAWTSDMHLVLNTTAGAKIRGTQSSLFKINEAGDTALLRDGALGQVEGFMLHESAGISSHTKGTGSAYVFNGSHPIGSTSLVAKTGSNTIVAGDVLAFEDDSTNKYVVNTGIAAPGTLVIGGPGLRQAQTDGKTMTIGNNYTGNFAFERNALHLLTRLPKMPAGGDMADDVQVVTDPFSGISFQVAIYKQYRQVSYEVALAWGVKAVKSNAIATLLG